MALLTPVERFHRWTIPEVRYTLVDNITDDIAPDRWLRFRKVSITGAVDLRHAIIEAAGTSSLAVELNSVPLSGNWLYGTELGWTHLQSLTLEELQALQSSMRVKIVRPAASTGKRARSSGPSHAFSVEFGEGSRSEGIKRVLYVTRRKTLCNRLWQLVAKLGLVIIKAPPQSGKTSLLQLVKEAADALNMRCFFISLLTFPPPFKLNDIIQRETGNTLEELMNMRDTDGIVLTSALSLSTWVGTKTLVLIDEAQVLYHVENTESKFLWGSAIKALRQDLSSCRIILACSYGLSPSSASHHLPGTPLTTPASDLDEAQVVGIVPSESSEGCSLQLLHDEWDELWQDFWTHTHLSLGDGVKAYIWKICAGQVGLLAFCLQELEKGLQPPTFRLADKIDANAMYKLSSAAFVESLRGVRSLINYDAIAAKDADIPLTVKALLWAGWLPASANNNKALQFLHRYGQVIQCGTRFEFTSPLHYQYFFHQQYKSTTTTHEFERWTTLELLRNTLQRMAPEVLRETESVSVDGTPLERSWQMEFYRALSMLLPHRKVLSPDFGKKYGANGMVDFFVPTICLAVEIMRDGRNPQGHLRRFDEHGSYSTLLEQQVAKDWAVIDLRSPVLQPPKPEHEHPKLYTVVFSDDYSKAVVWREGNVVQEEFTIIGGVDAATLEVIRSLKNHQR
eukprot:jgi/Chlat1/3165/Chrsp22S03404